MKLYDCKLRLAGAVTNEVLKLGVSAAEIEIMREIHGSDSVLDIKHVGESRLTSPQERARLENIYANPEQLSAQNLKKKQDMMRNLFGHPRIPLPDDLVEPVGEEAEEDYEQAAAVQAPVKRTKVEKPAKAQTEAFAE